MRLDEFVQTCWTLCDGWTFYLSCDKWWIIRAKCKHTTFGMGTPGPLRTEETLIHLYNNIVTFHEGL